MQFFLFFKLFLPLRSGKTHDQHNRTNGPRAEYTHHKNNAPPTKKKPDAGGFEWHAHAQEMKSFFFFLA